MNRIIRINWCKKKHIIALKKYVSKMDNFLNKQLYAFFPSINSSPTRKK